MLYKSTGYRVKDLDAKQGVIQMYWSAFGNEDDGGDIVAPGAFTKSIAEWGPGSKQPRIKYLWQHDSSQLLGVPSQLEQDDYGLLATAQIVQTTLGQDVLLLYAAGVVTEHSIGYETVKSTFDRASMARLLQEVKLYEGSAVTWGMNSQTPTVAVKSLTDMAKVADRRERLYKLLHNAPLRTELVAARLADELKALDELLTTLAPKRERVVDIISDMGALLSKGATGKTSWPLGERDAAWDNGAAHKAIVDWANGDTAKLKSVHFWSPTGDDAQDVSKYKLLFCDVVGGDVKAMPRAIFACAGSHGVDAADIPEADKASVRSKIEGYYSRMAKAFDDDSIVAPWKADAGKASTMPEETKPAARKQRSRPAKGRDFTTVYTTDRDPWDLLEDLDDMWDALREAITSGLIEGSGDTTNGDEDTIKTSLSQFSSAVLAWVEMAAKQDCWADIADSMEEAQDRAADSYGYSFGPYYYMSAIAAYAAKHGRTIRPAKATAAAKLEAAPDAPGEVKKGAQLSGTNRGILTDAANGMAKAMGDMKTHHKALTDLLEKTLPQEEDEDATGETGDDAAGSNNDGKSGKSAATHTAPDRSKAGTTRASDLVGELDALIARHR